jgi:hypothetical protein
MESLALPVIETDGAHHRLPVTVFDQQHTGAV